MDLLFNTTIAELPVDLPDTSNYPDVSNDLSGGCELYWYYNGYSN